MRIAENKLNSLWVVTFLAMFFTTGITNAQKNAQNGQQTNTVQRFIDVDTDRDGFISKTEFKYGSFSEFDTDQNGKLSRNEYRAMNRSIKRAQNIPQNGNASNQANKQNNNKNIKAGNRQGNGLGVCPNTGKKFVKKNCRPKGRGNAF